MLHTKTRIDRTIHSLTIGLYRIYSKLPFTRNFTIITFNEKLCTLVLEAYEPTKKNRIQLSPTVLSGMTVHTQTENFFNNKELVNCGRFAAKVR